ncbi:sensor histidine kinase [Flavobacterium sp. 7A]|uniref:sensor histidine kinase n=1 Tax=Flavobacterium sp. 7A TaxID=2940571 RepID=UPI00222802CB|nr:PAS domain-containing sensor histidine kinase [Flavobacterium sp. 7A]MCW2119812.1 PAS domain S-box-containing protein [Flavobacterium sp. 7A]
MFPIDIRTIYLSVVIINIINAILISSLYIQIKKRFPGTFLILVSFFMSAIGNILIFLRHVIPDWISILLANLLIMLSFFIMLIAFEKFVKKRGPHIQNYILIAIFLFIHSYFTFVKPDLQARNMNLAVIYSLFSIQIVYLMLKRTPITMRKITRQVGYVFLAVFFIQLIRVFYIKQSHQSNTDFFSSNSTESLFLLTWEIVIIFLAYSITLMYNTRLIIDVNAQEEKFSKAFHATPFIILLSKLKDGEIFEANNGITSICGYNPADLIGYKIADLNLWQHEEERLIFQKTLKEKGIVFEKEYVFRKKSGQSFSGLITAEIISINNEKCILSVIHDITQIKKTEHNLRNSETTLREINATKDTFFSIIAHDLRSPFNGIIGFSEILKEEVKINNYDGIQEYAEIINNSSHHAMDLLSNLMEWARSQTGSMKFMPEYMDIVLLIKKTHQLLKTSSEQKSIDIKLNMPTELIILADQAMIGTILRNIISNAIKFTPIQGNILITATETERDHIISINDNGIGIDHSKLQKLFNIDTSYSTQGTNNELGTGLGLILCKDFIEYHKGKIWIKSEFGIGSTFYFSIPKTTIIE